MTRLPEPDAYYRNGIPFAVLLQDKHSAESSNKLPYFQGDKATSAQSRNGADFTRGPKQSTPQTISKKGVLSSGLNDGIHSTEVIRNSRTLNSSIEVAKTDGIHANVAGSTDTASDWQWNWKKISRTARKRYHKLKEDGIPQEEARKLCRLPSSTLENMLSLNNAQKRKSSEAPQGPVNKTMKLPTGVGTQNSFSPKDIRPLCVGITNVKPMSEDQMKMLHRHLIIAITEQCLDGDGPEFLGFSHKTGWVLITCVNQRSKDWLVHEVPYLEPWSGAQLSIIPVEELPKPPSAITFIPESEAASVEDALRLFRVQNKDLNTELWKVRFEKVEKEGRVVSFTIDHPSADALRAQDCQAAIGFKMVSFKIKGQYRLYTPLSATQNQISTTPSLAVMPGTSIPQGSQRLVDKPSDQDRKATVTNKDGSSSAARGYQSPQTADKGRTQKIQHRDFQSSADKTPFAQGIGGITSWEEPSPVAAVGRSMPQNRGEFGAQPITQNPQGHGRTLFAKYSSQGAIRETPAYRNNSSSLGGTAFALNKGVGIARELTDGFGARPIFQNSLSGRNSVSQGRSGEAGLTKSHDGFSAIAKGKLSQTVNSPSIGTTFVQNGMGATVSDQGGFSGQSQTSSWFGGHPFTRDSHFGMTMFSQDRSGETDRTIPEQRSALSTRQVPRGQVGSRIVQDTQNHGHEAYDQSRNEVDLTVTDSDERSPRGSSQAEGGYETWVIEDLESYRVRFTEDKPGITDTLTSDKGPPLARGYTDQSYATQFSQGSRTSANREMTSDRRLSPQGRDGHEDRIIGSESHGRPFHGSRSGRDSRPDKGLLPHPSGSFESGTIESESHGRPFQGSRGTPTDRESRSHRGLLPHPSSSSEIESERHRRPFQGSRGTVTDQGSRSDRLSTQTRDSYGDRIQDPKPFRRPFQGSKGTLTNRESSSENLSPHARSGYGSCTNKNPESYGRGTSFGSSTARAQARDEFDRKARVSGVSRLKRPLMAGGHSWTVKRPEKRPR